MTWSLRNAHTRSWHIIVLYAGNSAWTLPDWSCFWISVLDKRLGHVAGMRRRKWIYTNQYTASLACVALLRRRARELVAEVFQACTDSSTWCAAPCCRIQFAAKLIGVILALHDVAKRYCYTIRMRYWDHAYQLGHIIILAAENFASRLNCWLSGILR